MQQDHFAQVDIRLSYRILAIAAAAILALILSSTSAGAQSLVSKFDSESSSSVSEDASLPVGTSELIQFLEENFVVGAGAPSTSEQGSESGSVRYDTRQFLDDDWQIGSSMLAPEQEPDVLLELRYDTIQFLEDNWHPDSGTLNVTPGIDEEVVLHYDAIQFLEDNWHFGSGTRFESPGLDDNVVLHYDAIQFLEDNGHFGSGTPASESSAAVKYSSRY